MMKPELNEETLTAYALGELDDNSRAAIEKELANNPEAREMVEEIRAVGELATAAFAEQAGPVVVDTKLVDAVLADASPTESAAASNGAAHRLRYRGAFALAAMALVCIGGFAFLTLTNLPAFHGPDREAAMTLANRPAESATPDFNDALRDVERGESALARQSYEEAYESFERVILAEPGNERAKEGMRTAAVGLLEQEMGKRQRTIDEQFLNTRDGIENKKLLPVEADVDGLKPPRLAVPNPNDADKLGTNFDLFSEIADTESDPSAESVATPRSQAVGGGRAEGQMDMAFVGALQVIGGDGRTGGLQNVEVGGSLRIREGNMITLESAAPDAVEESLQTIADSVQFAREPAESGVGGVALREKRLNAKPKAEAEVRAFIRTSPQYAPPSRSKSGKDVALNGAWSFDQIDSEVLKQLQTLGYLSDDQSSEPKKERFLVADRPDAPPVAPVPPAPQVSPGSETYSFIQDNPFIAVSRQPLSTFSIDVDTASYSNMRRFLTQNTRPPKNAVRVEELINYFSYDYAQPEGEDPFSANIEVASSPWNQGTRLVRIGLKGSELTNEERPPTNLVFLIDVSGSMRPANKLPLLKQGLAMLARQLREEDRVAMVVYAGNSGLVLPSTAGNQQSAILGALERLNAGGSTNGGAGIELAYNTAVQNFIPGGVNRVVLATDGDFNVGITDRNALVNLIEAKAKSGVFLSVLGFGMGNLQDDNLEGLANKGNGNYAYIDTLREARKVLVEEMAGTLVTIAKDVKIQVEFNPAQVKAYRLVGYENRLLAARDFNDDTKDAGEIGAGHTVTALYEIVSKDGVFPTAGVDALKYQTPQPAKTEIVEDQGDGELLTVKLRYKQPEGNTSKLLEFPVMDEGTMLSQASTDFRFATSVAGFGMLLRNGTSDAQGLNFESVRSLAQSALGDDRHGYRAEFLSLVDRARQLITPQQYFSGAVTLKGIYVQGGGAVVHLQTPQGEFRLGQGAQGGGYQILSIDASAGCVDVHNVSTGQRSRICV